MDPRWATKDHYERDTDETNRLVRPSPKVKPPRRDKRREDAHPDLDPDIDLDPDVARDPDLSMNYKTIGGSLAERVTARYVLAEGGKVKVRRKKDKRVVEVTREHLNENAGDYEGVDKDEDSDEEDEAGPKKKTPEEESPQPKGWVDERFVTEDPKKKPESEEQKPGAGGEDSGRKHEEEHLDALKKFKDEMDDNLSLQSFARDLLDPKSEHMGNFPNSAPVSPVFIKAQPALEGLKAKNFGELRKFINRVNNLDKFEKKLKSKWEQEDAKKPKPEQKKEEKPEAPKQEAAPAEGEKPEGEKKAPEQPQANPLAERGKQIRELAKHSLPLQQALADIDKGGNELFNLKPDKEDASSLFQGIPNAPQGLTVGDLRQLAEASRPKGEEPKKPGVDDPAAAPGAAPTAPGAPAGEPVPPPDEKGKGKNPKPKKPKEGNPEVDEFMKSKGFSEPDFRNWADKDERVRKSQSGEMLFPDIESKSHVPFEKLPDKAKLDWVRRYKGQKRHNDNITSLMDLSAKDSRVGDVLKQLANPNSPISAALLKKKDLDFLDARKAIPELKDVELPPSVDSVADLVRAAQEIHKRPAPPSRSQVTPAERQQMISQLISKVPVATIKSMLDAGFGPQDVDRFVSTYDVAKQGELGEEDFAKFAQMAARSYETDPNNVPAPKMVRRGDKLVPFSNLSPEDQAEAYRAHQIRTVALSMGARHKLTQAFSDATGAPDKLIGSLVDFSLTQKPDANPEHRAAAADHAARKLFQESFTDDSDTGFSGPRWETRVKEIMHLTEGDPAAQKLATAYFQGKDYADVRRRYLDPESEEGISERSDPKAIVRGIHNAEQLFRDRASLYPEGSSTVDPGAVFRTRVLNRLRVLSPEKMPFIEAHLEREDADRYDEEVKKYQKQKEKWDNGAGPRTEKAKKEYGKAFTKYLNDNAKYEAKRDRLLKQTPNAKDPYRGDADFIEKALGKPPAMPDPPKEEAPPKPPTKPVGYDRVRGNVRNDDNEQRRLWQEQFEGVGDMPEAAVKVAFRYVHGRVSSYPIHWTMGASSGQGKSAVYWGVDPYPKGGEGLPPSTKWTQIHQRDIKEADLNGLLSAAREWLKTPVLSSSVEGIVRDTQLRAALDLAIRSHEEGRFSVGLMPPVYNELLARLAGKSTSETLLTVREATSQAVQKTTNSLYVATGDKVPMKASAHIRAFAKRVAGENSALAFDLVELADKLASEEQQQQQAGQQQQQQAGQVPPQFLEHMKGKGEGKEEDKGQGQGQQKDASYKALRSAVIRTAAANPNLRAAFLPLLAEVKKLG